MSKLYAADGTTIIANSDKELFFHSIEAFGVKKQWDCITEEAAELIVAVKHLERDRIPIDNVIEEMVDVELQLKLLEHHLNCPVIFKDMRQQKRLKHAMQIAKQYYKKLGK